MNAGCMLLDEVRSAVHKYVLLPSEQAEIAVALWVAATHAQPAWQHATRLVIKSPEKRCGKSRLLDVIGATCHSPVFFVNASNAAFVRSITEDDPPTLLIDEADAIFKRTADQVEELRGLLNAGFQRNRPALRCSPGDFTPHQIPTFSMAALAAIGDVIPDTITDRAVVIRLRRRKPGEPIADYRMRRDEPALRELGGRLHSLVRQHLDQLRAAEPRLPVEDRAADLWEPLVAVADLAGGEWPNRARAAALALTSGAEGDESLGVRLLTDIRVVFTSRGSLDCISSADLVHELRELPESPWADIDLNQNDLAKRLRTYEIGPKQVRPAQTQVRGYRKSDFADAWERYSYSNPTRTSTEVSVTL